jgi:hypothetical protein
MEVSGELHAAAETAHRTYCTAALMCPGAGLDIMGGEAKPRGLSPRVNYADRASAACR